MLKHVSYRSSSSLGRSSDFSSCRSSSLLSSPSNSLKECPLTPSSSSFSTSSPLKSALSRRRGSSSDGKEDLSDQGFEDMSLPSFGTAAPDTISLTSAMSFSSLAHGKYNTMESRQYSSLQHGKSMNMTKYSSRCSSTISLNDHHANTIPVKVYLNRLRSDMEYKILSLSTHTTCRELILYLLAKFRLRHRDPNLFYVDMEVIVDSPSDGNPVKRHLVLNNDDRPAELLQCRPKGNAHFSIGLRGGGVVRVHDSALSHGSQYKSLLVSQHTSSEELIQLLLNCYNKFENPGRFSLYETCSNPYLNRLINPDESPVEIQSAWPKDNKRKAYAFVIRLNTSYSLSLNSKLKWCRSLDQSSTDTESEMDDHHNTTRASIMSTTSTGSNSSCSSGISSDASSTCSSSSGVSSGESFSSSPTPSPVKRMLSQSSSSSSVSSVVSIISKSPSSESANLPKHKEHRDLPPPNPITVKETSESPSVRSPPKVIPRTLFPPKIIDSLCIKKVPPPPNKKVEKNPIASVICPTTDNGISTTSFGTNPKLDSSTERIQSAHRSVKLGRKIDHTPLKVSRSLSTCGPLKVSRQLSTASNSDSGVEDFETDVSVSPALPPRSYRYSSKRANIRTLSRSSVNLSLLSPICGKSKSYHNLSFNHVQPSLVSASTPKSKIVYPRRFSNEWHNPLKSLSLSLSSTTSGKLVGNQSSACCLKCENCFYI